MWLLVVVEPAGLLEQFLPWTTYAVHSSFTVAVTLAAVGTPFFWFLTLINSAPSDTFREKLLVSLVHSVWWSFVVTFVGALLLCALLGTPALFLDLYLNFELKTYLSLLVIVALGVLLIGMFIVYSKRELSSLSAHDGGPTRSRRIVRRVREVVE